MDEGGLVLIPGIASGRIVFSKVPISFWGGIDTVTGTVIDRHHPLCGTQIGGCILAIPEGRGSCTGSAAILELLLNDCAPAALVFARTETILTLGVRVASAMFDRSIPVVILPSEAFHALESQQFASITASNLRTQDHCFILAPMPALNDGFVLTTQDERMLSGDSGEAVKLAMEMLIFFAQLQGATSLINVVQAHIDACIYIGQVSLLFPMKLLSMGAKFSIPSTLNAISVDMQRFKEHGIDSEISKAASDVANAYLKMGARISFTCAPYLLESAPKLGENIGWAESNAVVFANSVLGARTQKYPDFLDVFIALTGRAPNAGCHTDKGRLPNVCVNVPKFKAWDDSLFPLLGYCIGDQVGVMIPFVTGMDDMAPRVHDLKAFSAAFATTSSAAIFHIRNITLEASIAVEFLGGLPQLQISMHDLRQCWKRLNTFSSPSISLVSLGNPHFASDEIEELAKLVNNRSKSPTTAVIITTNREIHDRAAKDGHVAVIERFGASFITDTCWCMLGEPVIPNGDANLMTNSAKYAHYAPGMTGKGVHFGSLKNCVTSAEAGYCEGTLPLWLEADEN